MMIGIMLQKYVCCLLYLVEEVIDKSQKCSIILVGVRLQTKPDSSQGLGRVLSGKMEELNSLKWRHLDG